MHSFIVLNWIYNACFETFGKIFSSVDHDNKYWWTSSRDMVHIFNYETGYKFYNRVVLNVFWQNDLDYSHLHLWIIHVHCDITLRVSSEFLHCSCFKMERREKVDWPVWDWGLLSDHISNSYRNYWWKLTTTNLRNTNYNMVREGFEKKKRMKFSISPWGKVKVNL